MFKTILKIELENPFPSSLISKLINFPLFETFNSTVVDAKSAAFSIMFERPKSNSDGADDTTPQRLKILQVH